MFKRNNLRLVVLVIFVTVLLFSLSGFAQNEPKYGGTLRFASIDHPSSLDQMVVTSDPDTTISQHMFEGLYTYNSRYEPVPHLAESDEIKDDGKLIVIHLREGVLFHDGEEMTSEDVVASLERWGEFGVRGPILFNYIEKVEAVDKYTVNLHFSKAFGSWKTMLAFINGGPVIQPKEIMEVVGPEPIKPDQFIGTGPYKLKEWAQGRYVALERFDDYSSREEEPDGYAGRRTAYIDEIIFSPVSDSVTRKDGVIVGDYDWGYQIPGDFYEELKNDPRVNTILIGAPSFGELFFNSSAGIFKDNYKLRQAIAAAIDHEAVMLGATGQEGLYGVNGSIYPPGNVYYSEKGIEKYNRVDSDLARKLAQEAGYNGEKIRLMISSVHQFIITVQL
ncbi:MAG: ABC transporter substrate-binding protein [Atribacterota bacterium]|nr:ABC transporter substrate-binding protein [Atribacterota bacterium]